MEQFYRNLGLDGKCIHQRRSCQVRRTFERGLAAISLDLRSGGVEYPLLEMPCVQGFTSSCALCGIGACWYRDSYVDGDAEGDQDVDGLDGSQPDSSISRLECDCGTPLRF